MDKPKTSPVTTHSVFYQCRIQAYAEALLEGLPEMVSQRCFGCSQRDEHGEQIFFGSQLDHDVCTMMDIDDQIEQLGEAVLIKMMTDAGCIVPFDQLWFRQHYQEIVSRAKTLRLTVAKQQDDSSAQAN